MVTFSYLFWHPAPLHKQATQPKRHLRYKVLTDHSGGMVWEREYHHKYSGKIFILWHSLTWPDPIPHGGKGSGHGH